MQHTEQQRRGKDGRRAAARAHQALKRTAEQQFLRDGGHDAERHKLHEQLRPAAGQHFTGRGAACQAVDECARQIGKVRHAEKNRQAGLHGAGSMIRRSLVFSRVTFNRKTSVSTMAPSPMSS